MRKGLTFLLSAAFAAALSGPVAAQDATDPTTVVARVNGQDITLGHIIVTYAALPQQYKELAVDVLYPGILDQLVQQTALAQSAGDDVPLYVRLSVENERRALLAAEQINEIVATAIGETEVQAAYDAQYATGFGGDEYNASHILVETEEEANSVKSMLDTGSNFAALAKEKSTGPSGPGGGSLGWFGAGSMVPEFETAVVALNPGQVSAPVQTQFGWHVIILNEKRKATAPSLDEVREDITSRLQQEAVETHVAAVTSAADIETLEIDGLQMDVIRNLDLIRN